MTWQECHREAVASLMHKGGEPSPLWALALGLCGEMAELQEAILRNEGILDELGDVLWYVTAISIATGAHLERVTPVWSTGPIIASGRIADSVKKMSWHGRTLPMATLAEDLGEILRYLEWRAAREGETLEEVARRNVDKLRRRYPAGFVEGGGVR